jgi:UDP-glucose 4-epimerase
MRQAVITGGTGMLGRTLAAQLLDEGYAVTLLVRPHSARAATLAEHERLAIVDCDISELGALARRVKEEGAHAVGLPTPCNVFYHLGWGGTFGIARDDLSAQTRNITYALDAVDLAAALESTAFVGAGSQAEYGRVEGVLTPQTPAFPENGYGVAKLAAGQMTRLACAQRGIRHVWCRILSIYGPYDGLQTMVSSVARALLAGEEPALTPCGQQWDYLYVADACRALRLVGEKGSDGAVYCVGSGQARPLLSYVEAIRDAIDPNASLGIGARPYAPKQVMYLCADIENLRRDTGFEPTVSFEEGIRATIHWLETIPDQA